MWSWTFYPVGGKRVREECNRSYVRNAERNSAPGYLIKEYAQMHKKKYLPSAVALIFISASCVSLLHAGGIGSTVGGGVNNTANGDYATASGGTSNSAAGSTSTIAGGAVNHTDANYDAATISGGALNLATGNYSVIAGGEQNTVGETAAVISGGYGNSSTGYGSTIAGGLYNTADGDYSFIAGGSQNIAHGDHSFAGGKGAYSNDGSFVWSDGSIATFHSTLPGQFLMYSQGGFGLNATPLNPNIAMTISAPTANPLYASIHLRGAKYSDGILISSGDAAPSGANNASFYVDQYNGLGHVRRLSLDATGNLSITNQAYKPGGGSWAASSDSRLKKNVQPLGHALDQMLALKGVTFEYTHPDSGMHPEGKFSGFIAQEVEKVFPNWIGHDNDGYLTVGPQGFEALTVEALRELKTSHDERVTALEHDNADLRELVAKQTKAISDLRHEVAAITSSVDLKSRQIADAGDIRQ